MRAPSPSLAVLLWLVAVGVLAQAVLAGTFIAGVANLRLTHTIVGSALLWVSIAPGVVAFASRGARALPRTVRVGCLSLTVGLWIQNALGHMPFAPSTAVHVPLGALLLAGAVALAVASHRPSRPAGAHATPSAPPPPPPQPAGGR